MQVCSKKGKTLTSDMQSSSQRQKGFSRRDLYVFCEERTKAFFVESFG